MTNSRFCRRLPVRVLASSSAAAFIHASFCFFSSRRRHTRFDCDWSSDVCSSDLFGRGGEELEVLRQANIATVVVPGITAALGCAAEAGLPLTYRNEATRLTFVTAHRADDAVATDWSSLVDPQTTLVVYMGLASAAAVRDG